MPTRSSATTSRDLKDELGDLLFQVVFHARMAEEAGAFAFADVARAICDKMLRRHPHVFGDQKVAGSAEQTKRWEEIKREERGAARAAAAGVLDDVPVGLPALTRAAKLGKRAATVGFDWPDVAGVRAKVDEELAELDAAAASGDGAAIAAEMGDLLFSHRELVPASRARSRDLPARREREIRDAASAPSSTRSRATAVPGRITTPPRSTLFGGRAKAVEP